MFETLNVDSEYFPGYGTSMSIRPRIAAIPPTIVSFIFLASVAPT